MDSLLNGHTLEAPSRNNTPVSRCWFVSSKPPKKMHLWRRNTRPGPGSAWSVSEIRWMRHLAAISLNDLAAHRPPAFDPQLLNSSLQPLTYHERRAGGEFPKKPFPLLLVTDGSDREPVRYGYGKRKTFTRWFGWRKSQHVVVVVKHHHQTANTHDVDVFHRAKASRKITPDHLHRVTRHAHAISISHGHTH
ncbi:hypothetical protein K402DRAFT_404564 [Aulographum hederae CBS 113979]|uniref:Uncharacterized protein n=1 Tax=Aulographum hederae CBS 113979 TaxID=1176131 RepID=A0A6G1GYT7_9PEZI|nr:hypothetical protein K402DRAFT_404564 [Aulographum hederae CBS 113979]